MGLRVAVASGKGGTGKTLVATNLAVHLRRSGHAVTLVDCDVDAPNVGLFLDAALSAEPVTVPVPVEPDGAACPPGCTACRDACRFGALRILGAGPVVFADLCHHCGVCVSACPMNLLVTTPVPVGQVLTGATDEGLGVVIGDLGVGLTEAPAVVRAARARADRAGSEIVLLDAPPGAACAVVAALHDVDLAVLVTDRTTFGLHDLGLMVDLCRRMGVPAVVVVNRDGVGDADVDGYCARAGLPVVARLPFERAVAECYAEGRLLVDGHPDADRWFADLWDHATEHLAPASVGRVGRVGPLGADR